jgi:fructosamine-3-kinase
MKCRGEYESIGALYAVSPEFIPKPIGYGTYESDPEQHFFLCEFIDLDDKLPHVGEFCKILADLHRRSTAMAPQLKNPDKKFGFHVVTCNGTVPTHQTWEESWEAFYIDNMKHLFAWEKKLQGPSERIQKMLPTLYTKVIPRLLRPLETDGRTLNPCLLHGDLWDGNTAVHAKTDQPYIFDASSFWGHHECDLAKWRGSRYRMRRPYVKEYFKHFPISPPEEDWDHRNLLYSLRADLYDSILFPTTTHFRDLLIISLEELTSKFADGYKGTAARKGSTLGSENRPATVNGEGLESPVAPNHDGWAEGTGNELPHRTTSFQGEAMRPSIEETLDNVDHQSADVGSDVGVGESAISPPEGSLINA